MSEYHDTHPIHNVGQGEGCDLVALKREGDTILVYPGAIRLTLSQWASAVAFTTPRGDNGADHAAILALLREPDEELEGKA